MVADIAAGIGADARLNTPSMKQLIFDSKRNVTSANTPYIRAFKSIQRKLRASSCVIAKADKEETLIAITEAEYDSKIRDFLSVSKAIPATFSYDHYNTRVRKAIRDSKTLFQTNAAQKAVFNMNFALPKLYGQLKSHKEGFPLRPVVALYTDVSYKLANSCHLGSFVIQLFPPPSLFPIPVCWLLNSSNSSTFPTRFSFLSIFRACIPIFRYLKRSRSC